jgi:copper(I)-binding protein
MNVWRNLLTLGAILLSSTVLAHSFTKGELSIGHPWTRATPAGSKVGAGYLKITNNGTQADRLTGATFEEAGNVEIHEMTMEGDIMRMREVTDGIEIKAGETIELKPSSYHLMFMNLKKPITEGPNLKGSLTFEKAGSVDVEYKVEPIGAKDSSDHEHH